MRQSRSIADKLSPDTHNDSLASLRDLLQITDTTTSPGMVIEACSKVYPSGILASASRRGRRIPLQDGTTSLLSSEGLLAPFQASDQSSLLLLSGSNYHGCRAGENLCWLSPIALDAARSATGPLAFHSSQTAGAIELLAQRQPFSSLLNCIIYQLLTWDDDFSREWRGTVERTKDGGIAS